MTILTFSEGESFKAGVVTIFIPRLPLDGRAPADRWANAFSPKSIWKSSDKRIGETLTEMTYSDRPFRVIRKDSIRHGGRSITDAGAAEMGYHVDCSKRVKRQSVWNCRTRATPLLILLSTGNLIPNFRGSNSRCFDVLGFTLSGLALTCLMYRA
ncbi:hypothetical protein [Paraburkholderia youngii]|uniref:hypothetical protein n=1 Tax=Paraburkholderia youngii TaxID=2782701 RepID=UPI003D1E39CE